MSSQVISYRLSTDEVLQLRQKALPGESDNQTAQRLVREALGLSIPSTVMPSLSTDSLDERIESILDERLSSFASNQNNLLNCLQERLQEVEAQLKNLPIPSFDDVDILSTAVDILERERENLVIALPPTAQDQEPLTQGELAKRLDCDSGTLTKNRKKPTFEEWSRSKDPEGKAWRYLPDTQRYALVEADVCAS